MIKRGQQTPQNNAMDQKPLPLTTQNSCVSVLWIS